MIFAVCNHKGCYRANWKGCKYEGGERLMHRLCGIYAGVLQIQIQRRLGNCDWQNLLTLYVQIARSEN